MLLKLEQYALENNIPIIESDGIDFLTKLIKESNIKTILEIGSAIGYSAIKMALIDKKILITTIERDKPRYSEAVKNIKKFNLNDQIEVLNEDALDIEINQKYDLIFIDAAKSQYIKFFQKFKNNLNPNGIIVSDNLKFHGFVETKEKIKNRNTRQLVNKINKYITFLKENEEFDTTFFDIGDGISVSSKK